ncbi:MAG TPA: glycosyltransferase [Thermoanaerobaculia bacterium]|nr:glycosyltransferase [Thermoanaerobaculia bacterium]
MSSTHSSDSPRILFYSHDGFGLGHLRRNLKLAQRLVAEEPEASALLIAGVPGTAGLEPSPGIDMVKLPAIRKVATDSWQPRNLRIELARLQALRRAILDGVFASFAPHLVVVDYLPLGVWGELREPLSRLRRQHPSAAVVLGLRDVLDSPLVTRRSWRDQGHDEGLRQLFDTVHVYGDRAVYDTAAAYGLADLAARVHFTGYVCSEGPPPDAEAERRRLGLRAGEELALVTAGGGADAFPMMSVAVQAARRLERAGRRLRTLVVTGPLMEAGEVAELERLAHGSAVTIQRWRAGLETTMAAADVVVTMAAYNTLTEALRAGSPVISIPRPGPSAEQVTRAQLFAERGLLRALPPHASPERLAGALVDTLTSPRVAVPLPAMDGLQRATARLRSLLAAATAGNPEVKHRAGRFA